MSRTSNPATIRDQIQTTLARLYGVDQVQPISRRLFEMIDQTRPEGPQTMQLSEKTSILITYGDMVFEANSPPLETLHTFLKETLHPTLTGVHILPFYPYSSDDGFSVIDYYAVDPALGSWEHIERLSEDFALMFDGVFNHISAQSDWFQAFLHDKTHYNRYFITVAPGSDLSEVVRPRALPLLTPFQTASGEKLVWTTFSADQIDLNYAEPQVLLDILRVLLFYVAKGARFIRLDAVAFLWKEIGTACIHLEETHLIIQLMRDVLDLVAPGVALITETNVPHEENIAYFGDGTNEAQMVYQFPLPPLILHTLHTGSAEVLTHWAASLQRVSDHTTFFNFTASHDGIGLRPVTNILSQKEIGSLISMTQRHGGFVSYKTNRDGSQSPYELNITYFDAITPPEITERNPDLAVQRFMVSQAIALSLMGVPGIYFHSLFGSRNYREGVEKTGHTRTINREKLAVNRLRAELQDEGSIRAKVYRAYRGLLTIRTREAAFHPLGEQTVLDLSPQVFAIRRLSPNQQQQIIALHNVHARPVRVEVPAYKVQKWADLLSDNGYFTATDWLSVVLEPYQVAWLRADDR